LAGKLEGKRLMGRPRRMWVMNIKMNLREIGWDGVDWIDMTQDRDKWRALVNTILNLLLLLEWLYSPCGPSPLVQFHDLFFLQSTGLLE
jgi:hypothetical protein